MRQLILLAIASCCILMTSCGRTIFHETHKLENETWYRLDQEGTTIASQTFSFDVNNIEECYNIDAIVKVDTTRYTSDQLPLIVNFNNDDGEQRMFYSMISLRDKSGKLAGPTDGPYVTVRSHIKEYFFFNHKGTNNLAIKQGTNKYEIHGIAEFGLVVEKVNLRVK